MAEAGDEPPRRKRRNLLKLYYGVSDSSTPAQIDPTDINSPHFQSTAYMEQLLRTSTLSQLMDKEEEMHQQIKVLDRDMQTLVYDNYNKFISATDMIRKMKSDFKKMEDEMERLSTNVKVITDFSDSINGTLANQRQQISKLSGVHSLLKKLQFIFELPARLKKCMEMEAYPQAVRYYVKAQHVLKQYEHMPSFHGIQADCQTIIGKLKEKLRSVIHDSSAQSAQLAECVELLLRLREPAAELCSDYLSQGRRQLEQDLERLAQLSGEQPAEEGQRARLASDVLEFADAGCNGFLSNLSLLIASYLDLFLRRTESDQEIHAQLEGLATPRLVEFVKEVLSQFFATVKQRFEHEVPDGSDQFLVRALDRFHRKLLAVHKLLPAACVDELAAEMVFSATSLRVQFFVQKLTEQFSGYIADARQAIATQPLVPSGTGLLASEGSAASAPLTDLLNSISSRTMDEYKAALNSLRVYVSQDVMFACQPQFRVPFCRQQIRQSLVVGYLCFLLDTAESMMAVPTSKNSSPPPLLVLLMSRFCVDMKDSSISYMVSLSDEAFPASERTVQATPIGDMCRRSGDIAQRLIDHFVNVKGLSVSQMIRKSVETRDWLTTLEPRNVRPVMKRVVEDITTLDLHVGQLFEEGSRRDRSSEDSRASRRQNRQMHGAGNRGWAYAPNAFDSSLMSNIQKLFAERIEIFGSVGFSKVAVVTGVVKIALKTFLECVRLRTFGRYGLQQIQVDTHYLQLYLWRFVSDENLVTCLVDEVVSSTVQRCTDPVVMEQSVIEVICVHG